MVRSIHSTKLSLQRKSTKIHKRKREETTFTVIPFKRQALTIDQLLQMGDNHLTLQDYEAAIEIYSQAIEQEPQQVKAYIQRAQAYYLGQYAIQAQKDCFYAFCLDATYPTLPTLVQLLLPNNFRAHDKLDAILHLLKGLLFANEKSPEFYQLGAMVLRNQVSELEQTEFDISLTKHGYTLLHIAALLGRTKIAAVLCEKDISITNNNYKCIATPLVLAIRYNHFEMVCYLLKQGIDVNEQWGEPLSAAVQCGHINLIRYLIEQQADINRPAKYGDIPLLHRAVKKGHQAIAKYLLEQGADINELEPYDCGGTPLHIAVYNKDLPMIHFLLTHRADVMQPHKDGWTPIYCAIYSGDLDVVKFLLPYIDSEFKGELLADAAECGQMEIVKYLIAQGANINQSRRYDRETNTFQAISPPLIQAINYNQIIKYLLAHGADITAQDNNQRSILHNYVAIKVDSDLIKELITLTTYYQQDITPLFDYKDKFGQTVRDIASAELMDKIQTWYSQRFFLANQLQIQETPSTLFANAYRTGLFTFKPTTLTECEIICVPNTPLSPKI